MLKRNQLQRCIAITTVSALLVAPTTAPAQTAATRPPSPPGLAGPAGPAVAAPVKRIIAVLPFTSAGVEDTSPQAKQFTADLELNIPGLVGATVITAAQVSEAIRKSKKVVLRTCDGDVPCLLEVGKLVGANVVLSGELGGLGASKIVYLSAMDVAQGKVLNTTNAALGTNAEASSAQGALIRLLEPERYIGQIAITVDIKDATAYVDGKRVGVSPMATVSLTVGTHALRVTHPEYRDFVRFVDVNFGVANQIKVDLSQYPVVQNAVVQNAQLQQQNIIYHPAPWYRRWYTVTGGAAALITMSATFLYFNRQTDFDGSRKP